MGQGLRTQAFLSLGLPAAPPRVGEQGPAAAACYPWPSGEPLVPEDAEIPQFMELGRLLARLHQLGEAHPVSVADPADGPALLTRLCGQDAEALAPVLRSPPASL